jgi:hypothetical protein
MKGARLNSSNLDGTGSPNANPYDIVQNGGRKRRSKQRKSKSRKTKTKKTRSKKTKKAQSGPGAGFIKTAYKYFNIY